MQLFVTCTACIYDVYFAQCSHFVPNQKRAGAQKHAAASNSSAAELVKQHAAAEHLTYARTQIALAASGKISLTGQTFGDQTRTSTCHDVTQEPCAHRRCILGTQHSSAHLSFLLPFLRLAHLQNPLARCHKPGRLRATYCCTFGVPPRGRVDTSSSVVIKIKQKILTGCRIGTQPRPSKNGERNKRTI